MNHRVIYCTGLDQMFDLATNLLLKGNTMSEQKVYTNENELALWSPRNTERRKGYYTGGGPKTDFGGKQVRDAALIVNDAASGNAPFATLWWETEDGAIYRSAIFNNEGKLGGKVDGWWVNVYKNDGNGPPLRVKFKAMEAVAAGPADDKPVEVEDVPF